MELDKSVYYTKVSDNLYACHIDSTIWLLQRKNITVNKRFYELGCVEQMGEYTAYQCFSLSVLKNTANESIEALRLLYPKTLCPDKHPNVLNDESEVLEMFNEMLRVRLRDISRTANPPKRKV